MKSPPYREARRLVARLKDAPHHYALLGVHRASEPEELRRARLAYARTLHPDVCPVPEAHELLARINAAYEILACAPQAQHYRMATLGGRDCLACRGTGYRSRQQGFLQATRSPCPECLGSGLEQRV